MFVHRRTIIIEWGDCDPAGIVFYPHYFAMFDGSTAALFHAALGYDKFEMRRRFGIIGFPMVNTSARFVLPSRYGETIAIESRIVRFGRSSFDVEHRVFRGDDLAIEASEARVWAAPHPDKPDAIRGVAIPTEVVELLSRPGAQ